MAIPDPFVGWRGRRFYFKVDGYQMTFEGPKASVRKQVEKLLPVWKKVAEDEGNTAVVEMIDAELAAIDG